MSSTQTSVLTRNQCSILPSPNRGIARISTWNRFQLSLTPLDNLEVNAAITVGMRSIKFVRGTKLDFSFFVGDTVG